MRVGPAYGSVPLFAGVEEGGGGGGDAGGEGRGCD